jgi:hypothetical protein
MGSFDRAPNEWTSRSAGKTTEAGVCSVFGHAAFLVFL